MFFFLGLFSGDSERKESGYYVVVDSALALPREVGSVNWPGGWLGGSTPGHLPRSSTTGRMLSTAEWTPSPGLSYSPFQYCSHRGLAPFWRSSPRSVPTMPTYIYVFQCVDLKLEHKHRI
ncbi:unnamed protein product [Arctogadus glacialis]